MDKGNTYFANSVSMQQILEFEIVFPGEEWKRFDFYLKGSVDLRFELIVSQKDFHRRRLRPIASERIFRL